jgi:Cobalamin synthesis protein cobW C-terminal domain
MLVEGNHQRAWRRNEPRHSRVVLIGRNLPGDVLRQGFEACQA